MTGGQPPARRAVNLLATDPVVALNDTSSRPVTPRPAPGSRSPQAASAHRPGGRAGGSTRASAGAPTAGGCAPRLAVHAVVLQDERDNMTKARSLTPLGALAALCLAA